MLPPAKTLFPPPLHSFPFQRKRQSTCKLKPRADTVLVPPANRRVEFNGSGAPSWMMAQPQPAQGCAVCGAPSNPLDETREPAKRAVCRGRRLLVTFGLSKVTRQAAQRRRNPFEGKALAKTKTAAQEGCGFLLGQAVGTNRATGLRHGASWSCRRCLPARSPSR